MKASLAQVALFVLSCTIAVATKTGDLNLCKRQPFRGRCPSVKGKGPTRSQFVLRYYLRDNECVSYPFGHCADDENEPMLYRYKEECEKACLSKWNSDDNTTENDNVAGKSASSLGSKVTHNGASTGTAASTSEQVSTMSEPSSQNIPTILPQPVTIIAEKNAPHKLLTECEKRRQASESSLIKSDFIPICTADGSFRPLQCEAHGGNCFCVDHNGIKIPYSDSNDTTKPNCRQIMKAQRPTAHDCKSPVDSGPCNAAIEKWYYDEREQQCIQFEYSGCGGNGNNYATRMECEKQCSHEVKCKDGLEPLKNGHGHLVNCSESTCPDGYLCSAAQSGSACCPISASSKKTSIRSNVTSDVCHLPKERGPCDQYELRFYFNNRLGECKYFFYGGCEGNANNFERVEECERICRQHGAKVDAASIVSAPQLITSGPQMRKLNKEFGTKTFKKTSDENELVELSDDATSDNAEQNASRVLDVVENSHVGSTASKAHLETKEIDSKETDEETDSSIVYHDRSTVSKDLPTAGTNQAKPHLSQKIDQDVHKKIRQKGTKTLLGSSYTDKVIDFTTVEPESTTATLDNSGNFAASTDDINRNSQKISSESVTVTGQQLSRKEELLKTSLSISETTMAHHPNIITGVIERLSDKSKLSSASSPSTSPVTLLQDSSITSRLITSSTMESLLPQPAESINDRCFQILDRGTCTGQFIRWHWDSERNTCQVFTYSGCGGNGNNFRSREDCFAACHQPPKPVINIENVCEHSIHPGDCTGVFQRFAFDSTIGDCRPFMYTGCGGNGNNFGSSLECRNKCIVQRPTLSTNVCEHPIEVGECSGVFPRYAYDLVANECRSFTYGGCGGNGNNFGSMAECEKMCVREQQEVSVQCPEVDVSLCVEPCVLFSNRRGCRECTCPVAHSAAENGLVESSASPPTASDMSSSIDEQPKTLETEQFMQNKVEKKHESTPHTEKTFQTNSASELGEKCSQSMDAGPCKNFIERWFFDMDSGLCQSFQYGGCAGNRNHFFSKHECEIHCARFFNGRRRIAAYQNVSHTQHKTIMWSQTAEKLNKPENEGITYNQHGIAHHSSSNDVSLPIINNSQNTAEANSWKHEVESDPENRRHVEVKLEGAGNKTSEKIAKGSMREQQAWSISSGHKGDVLLPVNSIQQQTVVHEDEQISLEATKQQDIDRHQIDNKLGSVLSDAQNHTSRMTGSASKSEMIPVYEVKMNTQIESAHRDISTPMNFSERDRGNLALQQEQSQGTVQKSDISQIQQQNRLSEQQISLHNAQMSQHKEVEDITSLNSNLFDTHLAKQTFTDLTTIRSMKTSGDEQTTNLPQAEMSESQITRVMEYDHGNDLKKMIENTIPNEALISNSALGNLVSDDYKISIDQNGGSPISDETKTSVNSVSSRSEARNEIYMQMNSVNEPWKKHNQPAEVINGSIRGEANSQSINTHLPQKGNATAVAVNARAAQRNRDSVLRYRVRIINNGSVFETLPLSSPSSSPMSASSSSSTTPPSTLPSSSSTSSPSPLLSPSLTPSNAKTHLSIFAETSHSSTPNKNENFNGARGTYLKHAIDKKIIQSSTEEISHDSAIMHINTPEHMGQKFIASKNENKVTLPATLNNSDAITDSVNDNSIIVTRERPDLSPIVLPKEWEMDPEGYRIIDKFDITSQNSLSLESFMSTITPTLTTTSSDGSAQSTTHNVAPSLVSVPITLNSASHAAPTLFSSTTSINQSVFSSVTTVPTILTNTTSASFKMIAEWEPTTVDSRREGSFEPSIPPSLQILSQPIPHDKSWLYDGLQSIMNSQALPEQHAQQEELSEKKLSFGSFQPIGTFALATFSTAVSNNNNLSLTTTVGSTSKIPSMLTDDPTIWSTSIQKSSNVMDTTVSSVKLQAKKPIEESRKSMKESEENYFNADSSIFMNTPNKALTILSLDRMRSSNVNTVTEQPELTVSSTEEAEKERAETTMDLSSMHDLDNTPVKTENNFSHQFANTIQGAPTEAPASIAPIPQPDIFPNQEHRVNTVEDHSLHHLKHQELQQSLMKNLNEIQFTAAHDIQTAFQNISSPTTVKQGELEELQHDQITANPHQKEEMESEILNQQNISDPQVTSEMTSRAVVHDVTSLQQLQAEEDDTCVLPPDAGTCHDYIPRWFYNSQTGKCEQFSYGSCGGNNNNFLDRQACERKCSQGDSIKSQLPERCTYKKDEGHSNGYNVKWYFNMRNLRCEQMVYQGQGGNANQFGTLGECQTFCTPVAGKVSEMDTTTQHIAHSLKPDFAASQDQENQNQQAISITGTDKMSENQHHAHKNSQNAAESHHHHGMIPNNDSVDDEEIQQISSKQYPTLSAQPPTPATNTQQISHSLETTTSKVIIAPEPSPFVNIVNQSGHEVIEKKVDSVKTFGATSVNKNNDAVVDLSNIFEDINHTPSCPNGLKPMQHADGRPVMCLPGRNQCSGNSLCYFNGVDFFCCPNAEDPYDEHVFGGYGGEEVKHGYKSVKKAPINGNELIVRKLRLRRQTQLFSGRPPTMNRATRIDSNGLKHSLSRASLAVNSSDAKEVENVCMQDVNTGKCTEAHLRFFYDRRVNTCRLFYYSGCGGNENNFATEDECRQRCKSDKVYIEDTPPGSCPLGEPPLGDNAPVICGTDTGSFECPKGYYCRVGPPNVCCLEKYLPVSEKIMVTKKNQKNIRFAPQSSRSPGYLPEVAQRGSDENLPLLIVPTNICPDGSDALLDESTQQPLKCGLGYDGQSFCPVGYYCSIDSENNGRLCCQLGMMGVKIPPPPRVPPYFGLRPSNPGEVLPRGSLPSDHISQKHHRSRISHVAEPGEEYSFRLALSGSKLATDVKRISDLRASEEEAIDSSGNSVPSDETAGSSGNFVPSDEATDSSGNVVPSDSKLQDEVYGRMMLKSKDPASRTKALYNEMDNNVPSPEAETNEVQIDIGEMGDPFESLEYAQKTISDRSICLLKPNEGRTCREDESPPRTNLQYFYSNRDKRCKLYFYRGCGGSQNRFETKRHCELTCAGM